MSDLMKDIYRIIDESLKIKRGATVEETNNLVGAALVLKQKFEECIAHSKVQDKCSASEISGLQEQLADQLEAAQAKIDSLMLEYCPDEMTPEQMAEYEKRQVPAEDNKP